MKSKTPEEALEELRFSGMPQGSIFEILTHKVFTGNRPTNSIFLQKMTPLTLGALIALYEHKLFVQGVIWNIHSYDQWGIELEKQLAKIILKELNEPEDVSNHDSCTNRLINFVKKNF
uniref:Glucose-6-phosphate isomerase n=1 Tax=Strongyloides papillosus TaxID=174720 RepID=A0A0N5CHN8_STREA